MREIAKNQQIWLLHGIVLGDFKVTRCVSVDICFKFQRATTSASTDEKVCTLAWEQISIALSNKELCYYLEDKIKTVLSLSLTAIEHFHAELRKTNICCVTRRLYLGIIQARCSCCLLDNNFIIICRSLWLFASFDRKVSTFFFQAFSYYM